MKISGLTFALAALSVATSAQAEAKGADKDDDFGHAQQVSLRADLVTGYRMLFRYDQSPRCTAYNFDKSPSDQQKFCGFGAPPALDLALGFSLVNFFEPFIFTRLGLAGETASNSGKEVLVGAGLRLYTMSDSRLKIFFAPWIALDLTHGPAVEGDAGDRQLGITSANYKTDVLFHLDAGPQLDFSRNVGAYVSAGLTMGTLRYLGASAELALGIQLRAP